MVVNKRVDLIRLGCDASSVSTPASSGSLGGLKHKTKEKNKKPQGGYNPSLKQTLVIKPIVYVAKEITEL
jgi:hypothetical protein